MNYLESYNEHKPNMLKRTTNRMVRKSNQLKKLTWNDIKDYGDRIWDLTKMESRETKEAVNILRKMISKKDVTKSEKEFLKEQSKDIVRILGTVTLPMPITAILVLLGKKYNFKVFPGDQKDLKKKIERERELLKSLGYNPDDFNNN